MTQSNVFQLIQKFADEQAVNATRDMPVDTGGGGGDHGDMEGRVTRLEIQFEAVRDNLKEIKSAIGGLRTTVIVTAITSVLAVSGLFYAAQSAMLSSFQTGLTVISTAISAAQSTPKSSESPAK
jgi:hypothetical protein